MPLSIWLAAIALASALPLAWWALSGAGTARETHARANLSAGFRRMTDMRDVVLAQSASERFVRPTVSATARQLRRVTPTGYLDSLERKLQMSGMCERWSLEQLLAVKFFLGLIGLAVGGAFFFTSPTFGSFLLLLLLTGGCAFVPDFVLSSRADARQREIERALADALDQITVCVEAGLAFEAAVARVAESKGPLAMELGRLLQDIQIGIPRQRAFDNLLARTDVPDLRAFVHAMNHAERYGIPMAQVLRVQASEMRSKRRQRAEERAMKMPVKLVFPVVLCILPALFVIVAGPAAVRIGDIF